MKKRMCLILAIILLMPGILLGYGMCLPSYYSQTYYAELPALFHKLQNTQGNKIVIVGGSNVAFGVDSAELETMLRQQGFDYTVCNFGLYAAVGTGAMLSLSEHALRKGDIVVLAIEPLEDTFSSYFGATAMLKCAEDAPELLLYLNDRQRSAVVGNYLAYLQERAEISRSGIAPQPSGAYAKASFDGNGDMIFARAGNMMALGYDTAVPIDLAGFSVEEGFAEQLNGYIAAAKQKGARVVMSFSPMNRDAILDTSGETVYGFFRNLQRTVNCPIISDPNCYIMESGWFYDSNFHMNDAGMAVRTHRLGCDLLTYLGCSAQVSFEAPQMPASIAKTEEAGADTGDFLYEPLGTEGLRICGLTAQGREKESLVIPGYHDGRTVVGMTADALGSNGKLVELTLPGTVEEIPDGAFSGCPQLTKLILLHRDQTPRVGAGLLEGAPGLTVCVPKEVYHLYRDGADCAANQWEAFLDRIVTF